MRRASSWNLAALVILASVPGCARERAAPTSTTAPPSGSAQAASSQTGSSPDEAALAAAEAAAKRFGAKLRTKLVDATNTAGSRHAITVCATEAPAIATEVREATGVSVGRSSLRLRNPADSPPTWVAAWLHTNGERQASGASGVRAIADTPRGRVARVLVPIAIEPPCLACHGERDRIDPDVRRELEARYPADSATGYRLGELRGALWAEASVGAR